ncbi:MAG: hypothetical protein PHU25_20175 [Deltaproteobacteria bacterium]|nr:hypothetical protein [Deltaproteobacteria bacterium]
MSRALRLASIVSVVAALCCLPSRAVAGEREWNLDMQLAGHVLLGTGTGAVLAGVSLVAASGWSDMGMAGFGCVGTGIAVGATGMFLLGFSHPVHDLLLGARVAVAPFSGGAALALARDF